MDALGVLAMGIGSFLMFEAVKNKTPTPLTKGRALLKATGASPATGTPGNTLLPPPAAQGTIA